MPTIGTVRAESSGDVTCGGGSTPQKRRSISGGPISPPSPLKWKSPRRSINGSPNAPSKIETDSDTRTAKLQKSPMKNLSLTFLDKPKWNPRDSKHMSAVKEALHVSTVPSNVVCREDEQHRVMDFCKACIEHEKSGSLYVCGCPGTGKSLSMEKVRQGLVDWAEQAGFQPPDLFSINCTSLANTSDIFSKILEKLKPRKKTNRSTSPLQHLRNIYSEKQQPSRMKMMLIIADELDYLITRDRTVLHDLFMLTKLAFSSCILIGVSNAIDLADRFVPKLQSLNCKPMVVTFRAYSKDQILKILQQRLMALPYPVFQPQALELCARKVAAASGDMRKALSVCRSVIEILEAELRESMNDLSLLSSEKGGFKQEALPTSDYLTNQEINIFWTKGLTVDLSPVSAALLVCRSRLGMSALAQKYKMSYKATVRVDHMATALSKTFRSPVVDTIQSLPQHQQIILCSAVRLFRGGRKDTTVGELNKSYVDLCKSVLLVPPIGILELSSMCRVISDQGLLKLGQAREDKLKRVTLKVDEADIAFALQGIRFFRNCLH